jgi:hypothetical protein
MINLLPSIWGLAKAMLTLSKEQDVREGFEHQTEIIRRAAALLDDITQNFDENRGKVHAITKLEEEGDAVVHRIVRRRDSMVLTRLDREDVYALATRLDDVLDVVDAAATRLLVFGIEKPTSTCRAFAEVIVRSVDAVEGAVRCLRGAGRDFDAYAEEVKRLEHDADVLLRDAVAALFTESDSAIDVLRWKEIYEMMETVTDRCEDVCNVIEAIILKM